MSTFPRFFKFTSFFSFLMKSGTLGTLMVTDSLVAARWPWRTKQFITPIFNFFMNLIVDRAPEKYNWRTTLAKMVSALFEHFFRSHQNLKILAHQNLSTSGFTYLLPNCQMIELKTLLKWKTMNQIYPEMRPCRFLQTVHPPSRRAL